MSSLTRREKSPPPSSSPRPRGKTTTLLKQQVVLIEAQTPLHGIIPSHFSDLVARFD